MLIVISQNPQRAARVGERRCRRSPLRTVLDSFPSHWLKPLKLPMVGRAATDI